MNTMLSTSLPLNPAASGTKGQAQAAGGFPGITTGVAPASSGFFDLLMMAGIGANATQLPAQLVPSGGQDSSAVTELTVTSGQKPGQNTDKSIQPLSGTSALALLQSLQPLFGGSNMNPLAGLLSTGTPGTGGNPIDTNQMPTSVLAGALSSIADKSGNSGSIVPVPLTTLSLQGNSLGTARPSPVFDTALNNAANPDMNASSSLLPTSSPYALQLDPQLTDIRMATQPQTASPWMAATEQLLGATGARSVQLMTETRAVALAQNESAGEDVGAGQSPGVLQVSASPNIHQQQSAVSVLPNGKHADYKQQSGENANPPVAVTTSPLTNTSVSAPSSAAELKNGIPAPSNEKVVTPSEHMFTQSATGTEAQNAQPGTAIFAAVAPHSPGTDAGTTDAVDSSSRPDTAPVPVQFKIASPLSVSPRAGTKIVIALEPRSLGQAELRLSLRQDILHADVRVNSAEAKQVVETNLDLLQRSLERAGVTVGKIDVSLQDRGFSQQFGQSHSEQGARHFANRHNMTVRDQQDEPDTTSRPVAIIAPTFIQPAGGRSWTA